LSRDRFWGTPIPVWRCRSCGHDECVGSVERLSELSGRDLTGLDLHRPYVDDVVVSCPECKGRAFRVDPVLDAWFDSGSMPAAQLHYPFERADEFPNRFPADFICEAIDQTRGWFYSLLAVNTLVFERAPYRNVVCLAHIVDQDGVKMSKSRGNVIDPWSVLSTRGAEALRWYMFSSGSPWTPKRVFLDAIDESTKLLRTLWNTVSFFVTYANLDGWEPTNNHASSAPTHVLDRWILSRLDGTTDAVTDALANFDALAGAQAIGALVDDLSNWYVRRSRPRFWTSADPAAHATLHECLVTISLLLAPFCPFLADELHRILTTASGAAEELLQSEHVSEIGAERAGECSERPDAPGGASAASGGGHESVHLLDWPEVGSSRVDRELEAEMDTARVVTSLGRSARADAKLGVRQPLARAIVSLPAGTELRADVTHEVESELNVKRLEPVDSLEGLLTYHVVPNFKALGPRVGKLLPALKTVLADLDGNEVQRTLADAGSLRVSVDGTEIELGP
ncbi:MAG TPA: class I tRNA ligase family protein, partial [Acidimicrobiia bacterium]